MDSNMYMVPCVLHIYDDASMDSEHGSAAPWLHHQLHSMCTFNGLVGGTAEVILMQA